MNPDPTDLSPLDQIRLVETGMTRKIIVATAGEVALAANKTMDVHLKLRGIMGVAIPMITATGEPPKLLDSPADTAAVLNAGSRRCKFATTNPDKRNSVIELRQANI